MKKQILVLALIMYGMFICKNAAYAETITSGDYQYEILSDGTIKIDSYSGEASEIIIPSVIDGKTVTSIGAAAFQNNTILTSVVIPEGVTSIQMSAFYNCQTLQSITIPDGLTSIGASAFYWCQALTEINLPTTLMSIGGSAFWGCYNLKEIFIPESVTSIGQDALCCGYELGSITVDNANTEYSSIQGVLFNKDKNNLIYCPPKAVSATYNVPSGVTDINYHAFYYCDNLTTVVFPDGVENIGAYSFAGCSNLESVTLPDSVINISSTAFSECSESLLFMVFEDSYAEQYAIDNNITYQYIESIPDTSDFTYKVLSNGTLQITNYTGAGNIIKIPNMIGDKLVTSIYFASGYKYNITQIEIPESVTEIETLSFCWLPNLAHIIIDENNPNYISVDDIIFSKDMSTIIRVPVGRTGIYTVAEEVTVIGEFAFYHCNQLQEIILPEGLVEIRRGALMSCDSITDIYIPKTVEIISTSIFNPFASCNNLQMISVDKENKYYISMDGVLYTKDKKILVSYPDGKGNSYVVLQGVNEIGAYAFHSSSISKVILSDTITEIDYSAFDGCINLKMVVIPKGVKKISGAAFNSSNNVVLYVEEGSYAETYAKNNSLEYEYITGSYSTDTVYTYSKLEDGTIEITGYSGNSTTLEIPQKLDDMKVAGISNNAFLNCTTLKKVMLPEGITKIGDSAFEGCSGLITISLPDGLIEIGNSAFRNCSELEDIVLPDSLTTIGSKSFENCSAFGSVTLLENVQNIGLWAFEGCGDNFFLWVQKNSYAEAYAVDNDIACKTIELINIGNLRINSIKVYTNKGDELQKNVTDIHVAGGDSLNIEIQAVSENGTVNYKWLNEQNGNSTIWSASGKFAVTEMTADDYGSYECYISDGVDLNTVTFTIDSGISIAPSMALNDKTIDTENGTQYQLSVKEGDNLTFAMNAVSQFDSELEYTWKHNGIVLDLTNSEFMKSVGTSDAGTYICQVTDGYTTKDITLELSVEKKAVPSNPDTSQESEGTVDISKVTVSNISAQQYTGKPYTPIPVVNYLETALVKDVDYSLRYQDNVNAGIAKLIITGIGNYTGEKVVEYTITPYDYGEQRISLQNDYIYNGGKEIKAVGTVKAKATGETLEEGKDYTITYMNNKNIGTASAVIKYMGNYKGTITHTFNIVPPISKIKSAKKQGNKITLTWKKVSSSGGYYIYRSTKKKSDYKKIAAIKNNKTTKFTDKKIQGGKTYYYKIVAYKKVAGKIYKSGYSAVKTVKK